MKTLIQIILFLCIGVINCNAQTSYSSEQLIGTTWVPVIQPEWLDTISYTESKEITRSDFSKQYEELKQHEYLKNNENLKRKLSIMANLIVNSQDYYLSDTIPSSFDFSKVGKTSVGNYLVCYNDEMKEMYYNRIIKLDIANGVLILERYNSLVGYEPVEYRLVKPEHDTDPTPGSGSCIVKQSTTTELW